ncbi:Phenylacetone monooxygenase like protein [Verticillium longisporum]|uniref:Phenylacetone monooxygenase like protein n=1 Tax=Verticillium longisporum TaxID=100787 RepID=A0A8I2ZEC4_VERLO|nr:Phenylacetone monooxygenase like protein [Verticillium longisporum]
MGSQPDLSKEQLFRDANQALDYDVLIVGAGLSGIFSLHRMRELGLRTKVLEAGPEEGGTWFWNRYPGARFDSESYSYIFSFSQEVLDEWDWTEHFSPQPETLKYIQYLTKKFDLKSGMQFNTRIKSAHFQKATQSWLLTDTDGKQYTCRYLVTAMGILNEPTLPNIPGVHDYKGQAWHTARWPKHASMEELKGKRVGIIGTGATAIQTIQEIYKSSVFDMTEEERHKQWEELYAQRGFAKVLSISGDIYTDKAANKLYSDFQEKKIRARIRDPKVADKLIPKNHGFGTRRVPLESGYYEAFNEPHVTLVDIKDDPIETVTAKGIKTQSEDFEFDILIYATGFDAVTGSFRAVDFEGLNGTKLNDVWSDGIQTFLGLTVKDFPNMFMIMGPHQMFGNIPRSIEYAVEWVSGFIRYARDNNIIYAEATEEGMAKWTEHVWKCGEGLLANEVDSWMTGVNKNLAHKQKRSMTRYNGPAPGYRGRCEEVKERSYSDFALA